MLQQVDIGARSIERYGTLVPESVMAELRSRAGRLHGLRVLHLNATPYGGGVAELLRSMVPLLRDLGLHVDWRVIDGDADFFRVTKSMHDALQGRPGPLSRVDRSEYLSHSRSNAAMLDAHYDVVVVHDPQPAAIAAMRPDVAGSWVWRCHIDTSMPDADHWSFLAPFIDAYDALVFTMRDFVPGSLSNREIFVVPPAIDPLSPKNMELPDDIADGVLGWIGIERDEALVTQVSRFDKWKDPFGVLEAWRLARRELPDLQLAFVGSMALDDPSAWATYHALREAISDEPMANLFTNISGVGNIEVNAFQRRSRLIVQKSIREGFGLVVSEAMWKRTPVIAGRAGGIPLQMADGAGGLLVDDIEECAAAMLRLLGDQDLSRDLAERGHMRVRDHFLVTRLLLDELDMLHAVVSRERVPGRPHDPNCGMALAPDAPILAATIDGRRELFCSRRCRDEHLDRPSSPDPERRGG